MKKLFVMMMVLVLALTSLALAEGDAVAALKERGVFILGLDDSFPPMGYRDEDNEIVGFDIDLGKEVAARLGVEFKAEPIEWAVKEMELDSGNIDCIWNGMSITDARMEAMSMTFAYLNNQIVAYVMENSGIATLDDLAGKTVVVQNGSFAQELMEGEYAELAAKCEVLGMDDYLTALMDLRQGGCDVVMMDVVVGNFYIKGMGAEDIKVVAPLADDLYGVGFRKTEPELRDAVEKILIEMKKDGTMAAIAEKWFGEDLTVVPAE